MSEPEKTPELPEEIWDTCFPGGLRDGYALSREGAERVAKIWGWGEPILIGVNPAWRDRAIKAEADAKACRDYLDLLAKTCSEFYAYDIEAFLIGLDAGKGEDV
jgi:hypothetical protein